jgi:hypothetical protein
VVAAGLSLLLLLTPAGTPSTKAHAPRRPAVAQRLSPENAARAKRGLLPRKTAPVVRSGRSKRSLLRASAPTWLPAPVGPGPGVLVAEADLDSRAAAVAYPQFAAAIHGVEVRWMVIRHGTR